MKSISIKVLTTGIVVFILLLAACRKGEVGPAGKDGTNGSNGVVPMSTDGYITGTVTGVRKDGVPFSEPFDFRNYWGALSGTIDSISLNNYQFDIDRGVDVWGTNYAILRINTVSTTTTSGTMGLYFNFTKSLGANKQFEFSTNTNYSTPITGLSYNSTTGLFSGSFTYTISAFQNSSGNVATVSGSFQATMTQIYNRTMSTGIAIKD